MNQANCCRKLLSIFFHSTKKIHAQWFPIIVESQSCNNGGGTSSSVGSKSQEVGLHELLGLDYDIYISFMKECGLIYSFQHNKTRSTINVASMTTGRYNASGYTWDDFFSEFQLSADVEVAYICSRNGTKKYHVRVGKFITSSFTILEQQKGLTNIRSRVGFGCRDQQKKLILAIAQEVNLTVAALPKPTTSSIIDNPTNLAAEPSISSIVEDNFKMLLQVHFLDRVVKKGVNPMQLWDLIDSQKIREGLDSLFRAVQMHKAEEQKQRLSAIGETVEDNPIEFANGENESSFLVLKQYHIPLRSHVISALQRDIVKLSMSCRNANLLSFKFHNGSICTLVRVPKSSTYSQFKRNGKRVQWIQDMLTAATVNGNPNEAAEWLLQYLGEHYHDCFVYAAKCLGLLLTSKKMDAYSACAMWEEANVPLRAQRVILRHLANFFGRRITVPEREIRELEAGATLPISGSILVAGETITFWHREIDQAVLNRLTTEFKCRGREYFQAMGFDCIDIVFGGDHGARRFRAAIKVIFRNKGNPTVAPTSVVITIGNIDCVKETYEILEKTIAKPINECLKKIVGKFFVVHCNSEQYVATIADEPASDATNSNNSFSFSTRTFIAGDLAFFSLILGKENRSSKWCNWCMLSPKEWSTVGHSHGIAWTINKMYDIRQRVQDGLLTETPQNIRGCTEKPLIDAVPIENFILSILHIIIGVGNALVDSFLEWIEERVEQLHPEEVLQRNQCLYAQVAFESAKEARENWMQNEGIFLNDVTTEKKEFQRILEERVGDTRQFVITDQQERRRLKNAVQESIGIIKSLQGRRKEILAVEKDKKNNLELAKKKERELKEKYGKRSGRDVLRLVENVFQRHCIEKPYYHGGKYNGKAMNKFMTSSQVIMEDISVQLQELPVENRCDNKEVQEVTTKFKEVLHVFDFIFSTARKQSGLADEEDIQQLQNYIYLGMRLWRDMDLSTEAPKPHAIEDHLCDQMRKFGGIGDLGEDWVEQSHQDGIRDEGRSRAIKDRSVTAHLHCKWEQKRKLPQVQLKSDEVQQRSVRMRHVRTETGEGAIVPVSKRNDKLQSKQQGKMNARSAAFASISSTNGTFLLTGRQRNYGDHIQKISEAYSLINRQLRMLLAKKKRRLIKQIITIQQLIRVSQSKVMRGKLQQAFLLLCFMGKVNN